MKKVINAVIVGIFSLILIVFSAKVQDVEEEKQSAYKAYLEDWYETLIEQAYETDNVDVQIQLGKDGEDVTAVWVNNVGYLSQAEQEALTCFLQINCPDAVVKINTNF